MALVMLAAIVFTKSRSGFLGLIAMGAVVLFYTVRVKPGIVFAVMLAGAMAVPALPETFWDRMDSIMNADEDQTGSRAARLRLFDQGVQVFLDNPVTGIGAGQFQNYVAPGIVEKWRVTHNVWLQVASELGMFGVMVFGFLVIRGYRSNFAARRLMRTRRRLNDRRMRTAEAEPEMELSDGDRTILDMNAKGMLAAMVGWTVCSLFASVAFNWTFYYVLALSVGGREILWARRAAARQEVAPVPAPVRLVKAHA
jgi:O-antigen ligase